MAAAVKMRLPEHVSSVSIGGVEIDISDDGVVEVSLLQAVDLVSHGAVPHRANAKAVEAPRGNASGPNPSQAGKGGGEPAVTKPS